jgi:hypothetical protein
MYVRGDEAHRETAKKSCGARIASLASVLSVGDRKFLE